jgi:hypothetical protein
MMTDKHLKHLSASQRIYKIVIRSDIATKRDANEADFVRCLKEKDFSSVVVNEMDWSQFKDHTQQDVDYVKNNNRVVLEKLKKISGVKKRKLKELSFKVTDVQHDTIYLPRFKTFAGSNAQPENEEELKEVKEADKHIVGVTCELVIFLYCTVSKRN